MRYSTLLWDLDGTLYDFEKNQERSLRRILEEFGVDASEENVACYLRINHQLWSDYEQGLIGKQVIEDTRFQRTSGGLPGLPQTVDAGLRSACGRA